MHNNTASRGGIISDALRAFWREVMLVAMGAAGPVLILASIVQAADTYTGHAISANVPWLAIAWGVARAIGVTVWITPSVDNGLTARERGGTGFLWFVLALALGVADLQALLLFGAYNARMPLTGALGILDPGPVGWLTEVGVIGMVLIYVHAVIEHSEKRERERSALATQAQAVTTPLYPTATPALTPAATPPALTPAHFAYELPGADAFPPIRVTGYAPAPVSSSAPAPIPAPSSRPNAGRPAQPVADRIARMKATMRDGGRMTQKQAAALFGISESTAQKDLARARSELALEALYRPDGVTSDASGNA